MSRVSLWNPWPAVWRLSPKHQKMFDSLFPFNLLKIEFFLWLVKNDKKKNLTYRTPLAGTKTKAKVLLPRFTVVPIGAVFYSHFGLWNQLLTQIAAFIYLTNIGILSSWWLQIKKPYPSVKISSWHKENLCHRSCTFKMQKPLREEVYY